MFVRLYVLPNRVVVLDERLLLSIQISVGGYTPSNLRVLFVNCRFLLSVAFVVVFHPISPVYSH